MKKNAQILILSPVAGKTGIRQIKWITLMPVNENHTATTCIQSELIKMILFQPKIIKNKLFMGFTV